MHRCAKTVCDDTDLVHVFGRARNGSSEALGELFEGCRLYLLLVANEELGSDLAAKTGGSDLVQETFVRAQRQFVNFDGATEAELLAWLRKILLNHVISLQRRYLVAEKRRVSREVSLDDNGLQYVRSELATTSGSPSGHAIQQEEEQTVNGALQRLPERYQRVIEMRHRENLSFEDVSFRLELSATAARQLWARAVKRLRREIATGPT